MNELLDRIDHVSICRDFLLEMPSPYKSNTRNDHKNQPISQLINIHKGKCFYCKCQVTPPGYNHPGISPSLTMATREHLYSQVDIRRALCNSTVLSCLRCNNLKGIADLRNVNSKYKYVPYIQLSDFITLHGIKHQNEILYPGRDGKYPNFYTPYSTK